MNDNEVLLKRVLRVFRNAIVQLTRDRLTSKYGKDAETQLSALFGKKEPGSEITQWMRMKLNAERARASLEVSTIVVDGFELLGVSDFFSLFEKFHGELTLAPALGTASEVISERKKGLFRCLQQIKVFRDPNAHEVTQSIDNDSLLLCVINCKLVCGELGLTAAKKTLDELHQEVMTTTVVKQATVVRISDETEASDLSSRCISLCGAAFHTEHYRNFESNGGFASAISEMQNCIVVVAASIPRGFSQDEIDALNEVLVECDRQGQLPILLMSQSVSDTYVESSLSPSALVAFKRTERLLLAPTYEEATASRLNRLMRSSTPRRARASLVKPILAARAIHDDKLAPILFSMMMDPQLKAVRIVAPFATDMSFGALGQISTAMIKAKKRGCRVCLVTRPPNSGGDDVTAKRRLLQLLHSEEIELYVNPCLHSKVYLFEKDARRHFWVVGSHNMTSFAHNGKSLETSMVGYRLQEFEEAQTSFERARRHSKTLNFDAWASQQMRADNQPQLG